MLDLDLLELLKLSLHTLDPVLKKEKDPQEKGKGPSVENPHMNSTNPLKLSKK